MKPRPISYGVTRGPLKMAIPIAIVLNGTSLFLLAFTPSGLSRGVGLIGLLFFGWVSLEILRVAFHRGPALVIDDEGVHDHLYRFGTLPWSEVRDVFVYKQSSTSQNGQMLCILVDHAETYLRRQPLPMRIMSKANRLFGVRDVAINFSMVDGDPDEAAAIITAYIDAFAARHPHGRCPTCGYDLRATPEQCPECGSPFANTD